MAMRKTRKLSGEVIYLTINEWDWVSYEELWRSRRVRSS